QVKGDEKAEQIAPLLAGANCGGCGYPGCSGFAAALAAGKATVEACAATSSENKIKIAEILGASVTESAPTRVVVCCHGGNDSLDKYEYMGYGDCRSMELLAGGRKVCAWGCLGMGSCTDACHYHACEVGEKGYSEINEALCVGCGACIRACPKKIIKRIPKDAKVYVACSSRDKGKDVRAICKRGCIACGACQRACPSGAITVIDNLAVIDYSKCTGCGLCHEKCPVKCIIAL
ncbi:MAG TPA: 4Fe-4S binding protein, partial [Eubacteriales bacterium]|nr:4Fe-4S binding protein [Eubacteriales bacterium]